MRNCSTEMQIAAFMIESQIPYRLAVNEVPECPLALPFWSLSKGEAIWCTTSAKALALNYLTREPRYGSETASETPPCRGVRAEGRTGLHP